MAHLARKITLSKWSKIDDAISADAITSCLRTTKNTLSFWTVDKLNKESIEEVVLAMASSGEKLDKMDLVLISVEFFNRCNISIVEEIGNSKVEDLNYTHRDAVNLNLPKISAISSEILDQIEAIRNLTAVELEQNLMVKTFTIKEIKAIIVTAIAKGRLDKSILSEKIQSQIS
jgi:hypothetical protein